MAVIPLLPIRLRVDSLHYLRENITQAMRPWLGLVFAFAAILPYLNRGKPK